MSKLHKLKEWYLVNDAARRLAATLGEDVDSGDLLHLCLDGHIRLSWQFTHQYAQEVCPATRLYNYFGATTDDPTRIPFPPLGKEGDVYRRVVAEIYEPQSEFVEVLSGIYELIVETPVIHEWLLLRITGAFPREPKLTTLEGVFVKDDDGRLLRLMERHEGGTVKLVTPYYSARNFFPGQIYPESVGELVLRRTDLEKFEQSVLAGSPLPRPVAVPAPGTSFVDPSRVDQFKSLPNTNFDCTRLISMCEELNECAQRQNAHAVAALTRSILNHIPPVFGFASFAQVASNYGGASFKAVAERLEKVSRKIADRLLHMPITNAEVTPNMMQVNFQAELDLILAETYRKLK